MSLTLESRPRLKSVFDVMYLNGRVRLGSGPARAVEIDDPDGRYEALLRLLDGTLDVRDLTAVMSERMDTAELLEALDTLVSLGYLQPDTDGADVLTPEQRARYLVNVNFFALAGPSGETRSPQELQRILLDTTVVVFGLGGIGSTVVQSLAELGVGRIHGVDFDRVELGNLNRQVLYGTSVLGQLKTEAAGNRLRDFSPDLRFDGESTRIGSVEDVSAILAAVRPDFAFCLADKPNGLIDSWINEACVHAAVPFAAGGIAGEVGMAYSFVPGVSACYECRLQQDFETPAMVEELDYIRSTGVNLRTAVLGSECLVMAGYLTHELLRHVFGWGPLLTADRWMEADLLTFDFRYEDTPRRADCPVCAGSPGPVVP